MKKIKLVLFFVILIFKSFVTTAQITQKERKIIYPEEKFDIVSTKKALEKVTSTIKGVLFTRQKNGYGIKLGPRIYGAKIIVNLFPVTPYLNSWYQLRKKKENKRTKVEMLDLALKNCIETQTDDDGNFIFEKLKSGRYYLQSFVHSEYDYHQTVDTGQRDVNSKGDETIYTKDVYYTNDQDECIEKFVDVNNEGEIIEIKLK